MSLPANGPMTAAGKTADCVARHPSCPCQSLALRITRTRGRGDEETGLDDVESGQEREDSISMERRRPASQDQEPILKDQGRRANWRRSHPNGERGLRRPATERVARPDVGMRQVYRQDQWGWEAHGLRVFAAQPGPPSPNHLVLSIGLYLAFT